MSINRQFLFKIDKCTWILILLYNLDYTQYFHQLKDRQVEPMSKINQKQKTILIQEEDQKQEWQVQSIIGRRQKKHKGVYYKVKWKGFSLEQCTWEPVQHLVNSMDCVREYQYKCNPSQTTQNQNNESDINDHVQKSKMRKKFNENRIFQNRNQKINKRKYIKKDLEKKGMRKQNKQENQIKLRSQEQFWIKDSLDQFLPSYQEQVFRQKSYRDQVQIDEDESYEAYNRNKIYIQQSKQYHFPKQFGYFNDEDEVQENKPTLSHLNPHEEQQISNNQIDSGYQQQDKETKMKPSLQKPKILNEKDPIIRNKNVKINSIFESDGKLFAQLKVKQQIKGIIEFDVLKRKKEIKIETKLFENLKFK